MTIPTNLAEQILFKSYSKLDGIHPDLDRKIRTILEGMLVLGFPMKVISGVRTDAEQRALYMKGRAHQHGKFIVVEPGKIVTNLDGYTKRSNHQLKLLTGFGHAVDCAFIDDPSTPVDETFDLSRPWSLYGAAAKAHGLIWGGDWPKLVDRPHVELPT